MPFYDYTCEACGEVWEEFQPITATPHTLCPVCGAEKAKRLISNPGGFKLSGDGWAKDGYSRKDARKGSS
jgi:putative FmdB family regulatory protein